MITICGNDVTMSVEDYEELAEDCKILNALRRAGVDNWEFWDDAMELLED